MPAASHVEKEGCFTNTAAARSSGATRRSSRRATRARSCGSCTTWPSACRRTTRTRRRTATGRSATCAGTTPSRARTPSRAPRPCCGRSTATTSRPASRCRGFTELEADGSTACGCWIYSGIYADGVNQARRRDPGDLRHAGRLGRRPSGAGPGRPTAACSTTAPRPTRTARRGRSARSTSGGTASGRWTGYDVPDFPVDKPPDYRAADDARGMDAISGDDPFIMMADGRGWLFAPAGCSTARCRRTTSRSSRRSTTSSTRSIAANPAAIRWQRPENPVADRRRPALPVRGDDVPAHRAPHRRRHEPHAAVAGRAAARDVRRDRPGARPRARDRGRRLDDDRDRARRDRGAREGHRADAAAAGRRPTRAPGRRCPGTGATPAPCPGDSANDLDRARPATRTSRSRSRRRSPATCARGARGAGDDAPAPACTRSRPAWRPTRDHPAEVAAARDDRARHQPPGRRADGLLHRHDDVHRLQGVRGRVQAVERPAGRRRRSSRKGGSYDHTGALGASTWRHVRFVELARGPRRVVEPRRRRPRATRRRRRLRRLDLHVRRLQALHERRLPRRVPDRRADPHRVRDGRAAARRLQRLRLLHPGVPVRRRRPRPRSTAAPPSARSATTGSRTGSSPRARRRARPTRSSSGPTTSCVEVAERRVAALHERGDRRARTCTAPATRRTTSSPAASARSSC